MKRLTTFAISLALAAIALALPNQVYVFNGGKGGYDGNALGFIFQQMGFIDNQGNPAQMAANGDMMLNGNKVGAAIKDGGGNVVGYSNADGSKEAYDINAGKTANEAWNRVADNGTFSIVKHGCSVKGAQNPGGGVHLDNGTTYDGFGPRGGQGGGTGAGFGDGQGQPTGPYPLDPRPGANIKIETDICFGGSDPDGDGPKKSVADSAKDVPGVTSATGPTGFNTISMGYGFNKGNAAQRAAAKKILFDEAKKAGFVGADGEPNWDKVSEWMSSMPFPDRHKKVNDLIAGTGAGFGMTYEKKLDPFDSGTSPVMVVPGIPADISFDMPLSSLSAGVTFDAGDTPLRRMVLLSKLPSVPLDFAPAGARLSSGAFSFRDTAGVPPLSGLLTYWIEFWGNPRRVRPYAFDPDSGFWGAMGDVSVLGNKVFGSAPVQGVVAAYEFVDRARFESVVAEKGYISAPGDLNSPETDEMVICSEVTSDAREQNVSIFRASYRLDGAHEFLDVRLMMRMGEGFPGNLELGLKNWRTGRTDVLGRYGTTNQPMVVKVFDTASADYVRDGLIEVRVKTYIGRPLPFTSFSARFDWLEVTGY